jgi:hypothetical protein
MTLGSERWRRLAVAGIAVQFLALLRNLAEVYRLRHLRGPDLPLQAVEPFVRGALVTALGCVVAVACFGSGRYRVTVLVAGVTVALLLALKISLLT